MHVNLKAVQQGGTDVQMQHEGEEKPVRRL